jgi:hypothetical protein
MELMNEQGVAFMAHSESLEKLAAALAIAQGSMKHALRDSDNPFFKSKYADLASVAEACREALCANGLSVVQGTQKGDGQLVHLDTMLLHASGQWIRSTISMRPVKADPQGIGSCITYARRYALASMCGVAPEDDDGNAASTPQPPPYRKGQKPTSTDDLEPALRASLEEARARREKIKADLNLNDEAPLDFDTIEKNVRERLAAKHGASGSAHPVTVQHDESSPLPLEEVTNCDRHGCVAQVMAYTSNSGVAYRQCHAAHQDYMNAIKGGKTKADANALTKGHYYRRV